MTNLALADVSDLIISQIVGHSNQGMTKGRYTKRFNPRVHTDKAVMKLDFVERIGLGRLKASQE